MSDIRRSELFSKLNSPLFTALESATAFCKLRGNPYVELVHWLHQLMQLPNGDLQRLIARFGLNESLLASEIVAALDRLPRGAGTISDLAEHIDNAVERSWVYCSLSFGHSRIRGGHLLLALLKTFALRHVLLAISPQFERIDSALLLSDFARCVAGSDEEALAESAAPQPAGHGGDNFLALYGRDLTALARKGDIDPVVGRDDEIRQMVDILLRRRQNNPLLTGEAGVGKTALAEGLAMRIAAGSVPPPLQQVQLWLLDIGLLQAGASVKGEFESRLQGVIAQVQASPVPVVLFIDEIHTLIGAGGQQGTGDAANLLKPALARGQLRTIGATTWAEYKKYIEKDPALTRRFQPVQVAEPDEEKAIQMLRHLSVTLSHHHQVLLLDEAVESAVRLSHRYIPARQLPDKAIALLDTACARVAVSLHGEPPTLVALRRQQEALTLEAEIARREARLNQADAVERLAKAEAALAQVAQRFADLQPRCEQELALVHQLIALRAEQLAVTQDDPALRARLSEAQRQLQQLQDDAPLIFPAVDASVVAAVVADWTGIPLGRMLRDEAASVLNLPAALARRVVGQPHALAAIAHRIRTAHARLDDPHKPTGVFLLCGPSGVGKTETALALAEALYGGEQNLITINMSEFQEAHTVSTLKGAPPGYVGYGEGGVLTEAVRRRPYSVVLLDEIEKAHADVHELFFQVFDKGWMEDGEGRHIDFRNCVIILTSNIGSELIEGLCADESLLPEPEALTAMLRPPLRQAFPAALLGRLTVIPYYPLSDAMLMSIVGMRLEQIRQRLLTHHRIQAEFAPEVAQQIASRCQETESGGRMVDAILTQTLLPQISERLLTATLEKQQWSALRVSYAHPQFSYHFSEEQAGMSQ
ncbi:type VI secretion system ATPase TssH [Pantoea piersonii]|uniref:type VI secretion system ATPase TssH n=2 Tax=Pantoea TaxID=53335 RepID=UPI002FDAB4E3